MIFSIFDEIVEKLNKMLFFLSNFLTKEWSNSLTIENTISFAFQTSLKPCLVILLSKNRIYVYNYVQKSTNSSKLTVKKLATFGNNFQLFELQPLL